MENDLLFLDGVPDKIHIHTCTKDIAEQFDLKQAIKIPNLLSSQYAM